jgi:hypothetical protein
VPSHTPRELENNDNFVGVGRPSREDMNFMDKQRAGGRVEAQPPASARRVCTETQENIE